LSPSGESLSRKVKEMTKSVLLLSLASLLFSWPLLAQEEHHHTEPLEKIGKVSFPITCNQSVQKEFERGLALLHSFWYEEARQRTPREELTESEPCSSNFEFND